MTRPLRIAQVAPADGARPAARRTAGPSASSTSWSRSWTGAATRSRPSPAATRTCPGRLVATVPEALRPAGYAGDAVAVLLPDDPRGPRPGGRVRHHPQPPRVGEPAARPGRRRPRSSRRSTAGSTCPGPTQTLRDARRAGSSRSARTRPRPIPNVDWAGVVHNGLTLDDAPFDRRRGDALCFVGRVAPEKGIVEAIEIANATGRPLRIAAKVGPTAAERDYYENVFQPALEAAGPSVEFLGELEQAERDVLFAESYATLMPGSWPEPFGLVAIESLACGTPVIARRVGGPARDHPRRRRRLLRRRRGAARLPGRPRRRPRPGRDPGARSSSASRRRG